MTTFSIARPAKPSGELDIIADDNKRHYWGDLAREAVSGSDRGLVQTATTLVESQLKDLLLSDPGPANPQMKAMIGPGGALCHRSALINYLDQNGFMTDREAAAVRSLFDCAGRYFQWTDDGVLEPIQWNALKPFLDFVEHQESSSQSSEDRLGFYWACWEITNSLLNRIAERESGLA